jgi:hypothetical protein
MREILVSRVELISFLQQQLREQRQVDGATTAPDQALRPVPSRSREPANVKNVQLILPLDRKHQKHNKNIMFEKGTVNPPSRWQ